MRYVVKNLSELADEMGRRAAVAKKWADGAKKAGDKAASEVECRVWEQAEALTRDTEIKP